MSTTSFFKHEAVTNRHVSLNLDPFISSFQANVSVLPVTRANIANCHVIEGVTALDARIGVIVRIAMLTGVIRLRENALANLDGKVTFFQMTYSTLNVNLTEKRFVVEISLLFLGITFVFSKAKKIQKDFLVDLNIFQCFECSPSHVFSSDNGAF